MLVAGAVLEHGGRPVASVADAGGNHSSILALRLHRGKLGQEILAELQHSVLLFLRARVLARHVARGAEDVVHLPSVELGVEHEIGYLHELLHVRGHEAIMGLVAVGVEALLLEGADREILHVVDVGHLIGVGLVVVGKIIMIQKIPHHRRRRGPHAPPHKISDPIRVQERAQPPRAGARHHHLRRVPHAQVLLGVLQRSVQVPEPAEVQHVPGGAGHGPGLLPVPAEGRPVPVGHEDAVAVGVEAVVSGVHAPAGGGLIDPELGAPQASAGASQAILLVVAPSSPLDIDGPLLRPRGGLHKIKPVLGAIQARRPGGGVQQSQVHRLTRGADNMVDRLVHLDRDSFGGSQEQVLALDHREQSGGHSHGLFSCGGVGQNNLTLS
mmetsp:Transcript_113264/g.259647  ORF Transcript_113264/g.259647 Transcript_113264/m.259647 type:complete len:383 (-) Transcript_113264:1-1149(-)